MDSINRPTSRVLAAPGGRSSNIFGTDPEPAPLPGKKQANNRNSSSIFGSDPVESEKPKKVEEKPQEDEKKEVPDTKREEKTEPAQVILTFNYQILLKYTHMTSNFRINLRSVLL